MFFSIYRDGEDTKEFRRSYSGAIKRAEDLASSYPEYVWTVQIGKTVYWSSQQE